MDHQETRRRFATLTTAHLADACIRAQIPVRCAPALLQALVPGSRLVGRASPARHVGSVDVFLEALEGAAPGDVLVVDNGGRLDESCLGDLVALEVQAAGLEGIVIWGLHRDTADIRAIGLPVFSLGAIPTGPQRLDVRPEDALESAVVGDWTVSREDLILGDDDGVLLVPVARAGDIFTLAETIRDKSGAKPNSCVEVFPCVARFSLMSTLHSAKRRLPSVSAITCEAWAGPLRNDRNRIVIDG
jgi:regulator of RNase E activity RraA